VYEEEGGGAEAVRGGRVNERDYHTGEFCRHKSGMSRSGEV